MKFLPMKTLIVSHVTLHGYELTGSDTRTCQSDGSWDGSDAMCRRGKFTYSIHVQMLKLSMSLCPIIRVG